MSALILLACIVPPLAVLAIAAVHGYRTGNVGILSILIVSLGLLAGPALFAWIQKDEPAPSLRFDVVKADPDQRHASLPWRSAPMP